MTPDEEEWRLTILLKLLDAASFAVPVWLIGLGVHSYLRHSPRMAMLLIAIAISNLYTTRRLGIRTAKREEELRRRFEDSLKNEKSGG